jgi:hypothetical protein
MITGDKFSMAPKRETVLLQPPAPVPIIRRPTGEPVSIVLQIARGIAQAQVCYPMQGNALPPYPVGETYIL